MTVNDIINKLWYITQIIIIERAAWETVKETASIIKIAEKSVIYGGVNATRSETYKPYDNRLVDRIGVIDNHMVIVIK